MRLQGAVFCIEDTLVGHDDADKLLTILKMEGVWIYGVSALGRAEAAALLRDCGCEGYFRGVLCAPEAGCTPADAHIYEKAMNRLRSGVHDTVAFVGRLDALRAAKAAGIRVAAVKGAADEAEWTSMCQSADEVVERYADFLR